MSNAQQNAPQHSRAVPSAHSVTLNTLAPPRERGLFFPHRVRVKAPDQIKHTVELRLDRRQAIA